MHLSFSEKHFIIIVINLMLFYERVELLFYARQHNICCSIICYNEFCSQFSIFNDKTPRIDEIIASRTKGRV